MSFELTVFDWAFHLLPSLCIARGQCECCDEPSGWVIEVCWLNLGAALFFGGDE